MQTVRTIFMTYVLVLGGAAACADQQAAQPTTDGTKVSVRGLQGQGDKDFRGPTPAVLTAYEGQPERARLELTAKSGSDIVTISLQLEDPLDVERSYELGHEGDVWFALGGRELRLTSGTLELTEDRSKLKGSFRAELPNGDEVSAVVSSDIEVRCLVSAQQLDPNAPSGAISEEGRPVWKRDKPLSSDFCRTVAR